MQSMTNDPQTQISGSAQDELTVRLHVADKRCPICQAELASSATLIAHVRREHCDSLRSETKEVDDSYERFLTESHEWMKKNLEEDLHERLLAKMAELQQRVQDIDGDIDDGSTVTGDVTAKLEGLGSSFRLILSTYVDHYGSSNKDMGWGCGYRNIQMLLSCLVKRGDYKERLQKFWEEKCTDGDSIPSIARLQLFIEKAWAEGFDEAGAQQLENSLVGTRKWIGATEVVTLFSFLKIHCFLVDFHKSTGPNSTHPELFKWVRNHFRKMSENGFAPPLFLQHQGHSRCIIGVEEEGNSVINLMVLDPSWSKQKMGELEAPDDTALRLVRVCNSALRAPQYQIVAVVGTISSDSDYQNAKILRSVRIP